MSKNIEEILGKYAVSHKSGMRCKCVGGAVGHLKVDILQLIKDKEAEAVRGFEARVQRAFEAERLEGHMPLGSEDIEYIVRAVKENYLQERKQ